MPKIRAKAAYNSLPHAMQIKAAVAYDPYTPEIYKNEKKYTVSANGYTYSLEKYIYDKEDISAFLVNNEFTVLYKPANISEIKLMMNEFRDAAGNDGFDKLLNFEESELSQLNRFFYCGRSTYRSPSEFYLFDRNTSTLYFFTKTHS